MQFGKIVPGECRNTRGNALASSASDIWIIVFTGPCVVVGYLTSDFILDVVPQQWFSIGGDADRPVTSQLKLQPIAALFFGDGWNVGYSGISTALISVCVIGGYLAWRV